MKPGARPWLRPFRGGRSELARSARRVRPRQTTLAAALRPMACSWCDQVTASAGRMGWGLTLLEVLGLAALLAVARAATLRRFECDGPTFGDDVVRSFLPGLIAAGLVVL